MERNKVLDATKYLLIVLVVIGHFIEPSRDSNPVSSCLYCVIYSFHMPLFVIISGYFSKRRSIDEELRRCVPLLEICILSHIGFLIISEGINIPFKSLLYFWGDPAWYLLCLIYWRIGTNLLLTRFTTKQILYFSIIVDFMSFLGIRHGGFLSIERGIAFYPFFMLGYCLKDHLDNLLDKFKGIFLVSGVLSLIFIIITSSPLQFQIEFQRAGIVDLSKIANIDLHLLLIYRYILLLCAVCISGLVVIIISMSEKIQKIAIWGRRTLFIYFIQTFALAVIRKYDVTLLESLSIAITTIPIMTYLAKLEWSKYIMTPICSTIELLDVKR